MAKPAKLAAIAALVGSLGIAGIGISHAQTSTVDTPITPSAATAVSNAVAPPPQHDPSQGGHVGANGVVEKLLTGADATKATAAATAAVPGGTIQRVETDAEGAVYEAHMTKADGTHVTVKMDSSFKVTSTEDGMGLPHP